VIRRQATATRWQRLSFVELPTAEAKASHLLDEPMPDTTSRNALAERCGLQHAGVILVGDVPGHSISGIFSPCTTT